MTAKPSKSSNASPGVLNDWPATSRRHNEPKSNRHTLARRHTRRKNGNASGFGTTSAGNPKRSRRDELLRRLEVDPEVLAAAIQITPLLRQNGVTLWRLIEILRCDDQAESQAFVKLWDSLTAPARSLAGVEALAIASGTTPQRLWGVFAAAVLVQSKQSVAVTIALGLPGAMRVTVAEAQKVKGHFAREHLFKAGRVLPVPKGSTTNINLGGQKELPEGEEQGGGDLVPCDDFLLQAASAMYPKKALPAPLPDIESEEDEPEE